MIWEDTNRVRATDRSFTVIDPRHSVLLSSASVARLFPWSTRDRFPCRQCRFRALLWIEGRARCSSVNRGIVQSSFPHPWKQDWCSWCGQWRRAEAPPWAVSDNWQGGNYSFESVIRNWVLFCLRGKFLSATLGRLRFSCVRWSCVKVMEKVRTTFLGP